MNTYLKGSDIAVNLHVKLNFDERKQYRVGKTNFSKKPRIVLIPKISRQCLCVRMNSHVTGSKTPAEKCQRKENQHNQVEHIPHALRIFVKSTHPQHLQILEPQTKYVYNYVELTQSLRRPALIVAVQTNLQYISSNLTFLLTSI